MIVNKLILEAKIGVVAGHLINAADKALQGISVHTDWELAQNALSDLLRDLHQTKIQSNKG